MHTILSVHNKDLFIHAKANITRHEKETNRNRQNKE